MANKYLEKIAGILGDTAIASAHLARKATSGIVRTVHKANGGAYRDFAAENIRGINADKISRINASYKGRRQLVKAYRESMNFKPGKGRSNNRGELRSRSIKFGHPGAQKQLKRETLSAKLGLTLGVGGTVYAGNKYLEKARAKANNVSAYPEYPSYY